MIFLETVAEVSAMLGMLGSKGNSPETKREANLKIKHKNAAGEKKHGSYFF
jgi:hypothetical protein